MLPGPSIPITTAPGYEDFAATVLEMGGAEDVLWTPAGAAAATVRAIVREAATSIQGPSGTSRHPLYTLLVSAADVQEIAPGDRFALRGRHYTVFPGGLFPDGVAMVQVELSPADPPEPEAPDES